MARFDQQWCDDLVSEVDGFGNGMPLRVLFVVTDTDDGKVAFLLHGGDRAIAATAGKLPRGEKADVTVTAKEAVLSELWSGSRSRDQAFMAGDIKVEGAYQRWVDELVPCFEGPPWVAAWATA